MCDVECAGSCVKFDSAQCRCLPSVDATIKWVVMLRHLLKDDTVSEFNVHGLSRYGYRIIASAVGCSVFTLHTLCCYHNVLDARSQSVGAAGRTRLRGAHSRAGFPDAAQGAGRGADTGGVRAS